MNEQIEFAFPLQGEWPGLTKREYFAGLAMQGLLAADSYSDNDNWLGLIAETSVNLSDALLAALNPKTTVNNG